MIAYGLYAFSSESFTIPHKSRAYAVEGDIALSFSVALSSAGLALHFHYIWGLTKGLWRISELAKVIAMLGTVIFMGRGLYLFMMS